MGGSAIGGDLCRVLILDEMPVPVIVIRNYRLPAWVNANTLVICSSYSGNTEETLSVFQQARESEAKICGISTGGELTSRLQNGDYDVVTIPSGLQPRAALGYSFVPMLYLLKKCGLLRVDLKDELSAAIERLKKVRDSYALESEENPTYVLAREIYRTIPILYGETEATSVIALRWKGQFCENAKMLAYNNDLPEMNHNEIVGWENNKKLFQHLSILWIQDAADQERVQYRQRITRQLLDPFGLRQEVIQMDGSSRIERYLHLIHFGDWVSYWCARLHGTDPTPVEKISRLKSELAKIPLGK
jgi:glucose/mannose-6-phosphate isomerase